VGSNPAARTFPANTSQARLRHPPPRRMPRAENWSQLKLGIMVAVVIVAAVASVLFFARIGALHGKTTRLYMVTDMASGVLNGTDVWLAGEKIGLVRSVELRPPSTDTSERVAITMDVLDPYVKYIRRNSDVQIRPGGRLIGSPVVNITFGTTAAPPVRNGDTLRAQAQLEAHSGLADASSLGDSLNSIVGSASTIKSELHTTINTVSELRKSSQQQMEAVHRAADNFTDRALASHGTVASLVRDTASFRKQVVRMRAVADSIEEAANGKGEIGRFRRDSTLVLQARQALATVTDLRARLARYMGDSVRGAAMAAQLDTTHARLDSVVRDAKKHPLRYITF
jgi:ABC-type transporter Mla subunit MlaD